jgi:hypothetical protein
MSIGTAIPSRLGDQPDSVGGVYPLAGGQYKAVESRSVSKPLEFEGFKTDVPSF